MTQYIPYIRTKEGILERKDYAIFNSDELLDCYVHEETLIGWPEPKVFWENKVGPSLGLAPLASGQ